MQIFVVIWLHARVPFCNSRDVLVISNNGRHMYPAELNFRFKTLHRDYCILHLSVSFELSLEPSGNLLSIGLTASELILITHSSCLDILSTILKSVDCFKKFIISQNIYGIIHFNCNIFRTCTFLSINNMFQYLLNCAIHNFQGSISFINLQ